jgi:prophage maintenance system killer protein
MKQLQQWQPLMRFIFVKTIHVIDGNKRVALASSLVFLDINGYELNCKDKTLEDFPKLQLLENLP